MFKFLSSLKTFSTFIHESKRIFLAYHSWLRDRIEMTISREAGKLHFNLPGNPLLILKTINFWINRNMLSCIWIHATNNKSFWPKIKGSNSAKLKLQLMNNFNSIHTTKTIQGWMMIIFQKSQQFMEADSVRSQMIDVVITHECWQPPIPNSSEMVWKDPEPAEQQLEEWILS